MKRTIFENKYGNWKLKITDYYILPYVAHRNEPIDMANRMKNKKFVCSNIKINLHTIKAKTIGSKQ